MTGECRAIERLGKRPRFQNNPARYVAKDLQEVFDGYDLNLEIEIC